MKYMCEKLQVGNFILLIKGENFALMLGNWNHRCFEFNLNDPESTKFIKYRTL